MKKIEDFEKEIDNLDDEELLEFFKHYNLTYPIDLEVIKKSLENIEPTLIPEEDEEMFLSTMINTMELYKEAKEKLENPNKATSFGELLFLYREKERLSINDIAEYFDVDTSIIRSIEDDCDSKMRLNIKIYVLLTRLICISYNEAKRLIVKSFGIFNMKLNKGFSRSYARAGKEMSELIRNRRIKETDDKTLLRLWEKRQTEVDKEAANEIEKIFNQEFIKKEER